MIELRVLAGKQAGEAFLGARLPLTVGRGVDASVRLEEKGVWDKHALFTRTSNGEIQVEAQGDASILVNGQRMARGVLKVGDILDLGGSKLLFTLSAPVQGTLKPREMLTWSIVLLVTLFQGLILFWSAQF